MGLDMFAKVTYAPIPPVDFEPPEDETQLHYWRKHPNLHGWMESLYRAKGGTKEQFNCAPVRLDPVDLDLLEIDIKGNQLPPTQGFFFGVSRPEEKEGDLKFITKAREAISRGAKVYYTSWW